MYISLGQCPYPCIILNWCCLHFIHSEHHYQAYKSHDHDHQWTDYVMTWLPYDKKKREHNVTRLVRLWLFIFCSIYILISAHGIDFKQTWCKKIYCMDIVIWLKPLIITKTISLFNHVVDPKNTQYKFLTQLKLTGRIYIRQPDPSSSLTDQRD